MADTVAVRRVDGEQTCRLHASIVLIAEDQSAVDAVQAALRSCDCDIIAIPSESRRLVLIRPRSSDSDVPIKLLVEALRIEAVHASYAVKEPTDTVLSGAESLIAALTYAPALEVSRVLDVLRDSGSVQRVNAETGGLPRLVSAEACDHTIPTAIGDRWAWYALKGCAARSDPSTLRHWASECAVSYSTLTEMCRLNAMKPLSARDFVRVLRALRRASVECTGPDAHLAVSDSRTLRALSRRAGINLELQVRDRIVPQFLAAQTFLDPGSYGLRAMRRAICEW